MLDQPGIDENKEQAGSKNNQIAGNESTMHQISAGAHCNEVDGGESRCQPEAGCFLVTAKNKGHQQNHLQRRKCQVHPTSRQYDATGRDHVSEIKAVVLPICVRQCIEGYGNAKNEIELLALLLVNHADDKKIEWDKGPVHHHDREVVK